MPQKGDLLRKACRDEYESHLIYRRLASSPLISKRLREALGRASEDELRHYLILREVVGECAGGPAPLKAILYTALLHLFGATVVVKLLESKEVGAQELYAAAAEVRQDLGEALRGMAEDEERHEAEFASGIDEGRVKYLGSIALGVSDALVELTGIYAGSLGAFYNATAAGLTGLLAGLAASISMGVAAYSQAKHEGGRSPRLSALYTLASYLAVAGLLSAPYFLVGAIHAAFAVMTALALLAVAYITFYAAVLKKRNYLREFAEAAALLLGTSMALYLLGSALGRALGVAVAP